MAEPWVEDITDGEGRELHLVHPRRASGPGVIWLHWFDEAPSANRGQFLGEARALADSGVASVLPQLAFPWQSPPTNTEDDLARIHQETMFLNECLQRLAEIEGVDRSRIAMVGHDFGAMHGMVLFGRGGLAAAVLVAPTPRWADWFLRFWAIESDRYDYMRALEVVDPITTVGRAEFPLLFQFGKADFYIAPMSGLELFNAAPEPKELLSYASGHEMDGADIQRDRTEFLKEHLGF